MLFHISLVLQHTTNLNPGAPDYICKKTCRKDILVPANCKCHGSDHYEVGKLPTLCSNILNSSK